MSSSVANALTGFGAGLTGDGVTGLSVEVERIPTGVAGFSVDEGADCGFVGLVGDVGLNGDDCGAMVGVAGFGDDPCGAFGCIGEFADGDCPAVVGIAGLKGCD